MHVLTAVMTSGTSTSPLKDDGVVGVGRGDVDDLSNTFHRTGLEGNVLDSRRLEVANDLGSLLRRRDTGSDTETFDGKTFPPHLLPERVLEGELPLVDVQGVQSDSDTRFDLALNLGDLGTERLGVVVGTSGQLDVVTGVEGGRDHAGGHGTRGHTSDHDRRLSEQSRERRVDVKLAIGRLDQLGRKLVRPPLFGLDRTGRVDLGTVLALVTNDDDPDTSTLQSSGGDGTGSGKSAWTKVDRMGSSLREVGRLLPVDRRGEDLVAQRGGDGSREVLEVLAWKKITQRADADQYFRKLRLENALNAKITYQTRCDKVRA